MNGLPRHGRPFGFDNALTNFIAFFFFLLQPEEIRATFNITNDFSPEEEAQVREENKWCEEA